MRVNPIAIPGMRYAPLRPLDPLRHAEHTAYYVDVDGAAEAYEQFRNAFADPAAWREIGALAIAAGFEQTGKSALLNRCAQWLRSERMHNGEDVVVADLRSAPVTDAQSIDHRMATVCRHLVMTLYQERRLTDDRLLALREPAEILPYLRYQLADHPTLLLVLLPPSADLPEELVAYARLAPPGVLLLGETAYVSRLNDVAARLETAPAHTRILHLDRLRPGDGDEFYRRRRELHPADADVPEPSPDLLPRLVSLRPISIGELQHLLYDLYQELLYIEPDVRAVTFEMITAFYFRKTALGAGR